MTHSDSPPSQPPPSVTRDRAHRNPWKDGDADEVQVEQEGEAAPRLPHELDESTDSQTPSDGEPTDVGRQAHADIAHGIVDTDRGPVMDKLRERLDREEED